MPVRIGDLAAMQLHQGGFGPSEVEFDHGALAVDAIGHATAEDMFVALRGLVSEEVAKQLVAILDENELLFDSTIETELDE